MTAPSPLHLFDAYGVEIEYMLVQADTLDVLPASDQVLRDSAGQITGELELGDIHWSNELVLHVIELKAGRPAGQLAPLASRFQDHVGQIQQRLAPLGGRLMPSAMHPWMDPATEMRLWPHDYSPVYDAYHRIFDCRGHGWANLQSVHLNLPFSGDAEFARLHAAIRLLLPVLPALAASSPVFDGQLTGLADNRMAVYLGNSRRIPSITGDLIPEPVFTQRDYQRQILGRMYADIAPLDPEGLLQHEFLNSRGAIARFERDAIEIRVLDVQECPRADLALCTAATEVLRALAAERWTGLDAQKALSTEPLAALFRAMLRDGERTVIRDSLYLEQFGYPGSACRAGELWQHLAEATGLLESPWKGPLEMIFRHGPLARRIARALGVEISGPATTVPRERLAAVYRRLCDCLSAGELFLSPE